MLTLRLLKINYALIKHQMDLHYPIPWLLKLLKSFTPWLWRKKKLTIGEATYNLLIELGPLFIKLGQTLSTRSDLLGVEVTRDLAKLQDKVPSFNGTIVRESIEKELKAKIEDIFNDFDNEAIACASIAQVHNASLLDGTKVVVKVLRPGVERAINKDLRSMLFLIKLINVASPKTKKLKLLELAREFARTVTKELNLRQEAANASQLRLNLAKQPQVQVPEIFFQYSSNKVLTMRRAEGLPLSQLIHNTYLSNIEKEDLAKLIIQTFLQQAFKQRFFHADLHPGNMFVQNHSATIHNSIKPNSITLHLVDCGIMGSLSKQDTYYLMHNLTALFKRDYEKVTELHVHAGWLRNEIIANEFTATLREVCEPVFNSKLNQVSFSNLFSNLITTAERFHINIQPQFLLLQKTSLNVEGLCRELAPELDFWHVTAKVLQDILQPLQVSKLPSLLRESITKLPETTEHLTVIAHTIKEALSEKIEEINSKNKRRPVKPPKPSNWQIIKRELLKGLAIGVGLSISATIALLIKELILG